MRIVALGLLVLASCASSTAQIEIHRGKLASNEEVGEPLELTPERNDKRTRNSLVFVEVTLENTGSDFVTVSAHGLGSADAYPALSLVTGRELAAWIEDEANRQASAGRSSVGFSIGGFGFGGGGRGGGVGAGVGVGIGGGGSAPADASAAREANLRGGGFPNDHLFAGEIAIAPKATIKRWFLLQTDSEKSADRERALGVDVTLTSRGASRERRYILVF